MTTKQAVNIIESYKPTVYILHLVLGKDNEHRVYAFNRRVDRVHFEMELTAKIGSEIKSLTRSEVILNPPVIDTVRSIKEWIQ